MPSNTGSTAAATNGWTTRVAVAKVAGLRSFQTRRSRWTEALWCGLLLVPALLATRAGGLIDPRLGAIQVGNLGAITTADMALLLLLLLGLAKVRAITTSSISLAVSGVVVLIALQITRNLMARTDPSVVINGARACLFYLSFYIVALAVTDTLVLGQLVTWLLIFAGVESVATLLIYFGALESPGVYIAAIETQTWLALPRIYPPGEYLLDLAFCVALAAWMSRERLPTPRWLISIVLALTAASILVSLARSTYLTTIGAAILISRQQRHALSAARLQLIAMAAILTIIVWVGVNSIFGVGFQPFIEAIVQTPSGIRDGSGSFVQRLEILSTKSAATTDYNPLIGRGFDWGDQSLYRSIEDNPASRSNHSGIASIYVVFGGLGLLLFGWLFLAGISTCRTLEARSLSPTIRAVSLGLRAFLLIVLAKSWVTDPFTDATGIVALAIAFGMLRGAESLPIAFCDWRNSSHSTNRQFRRH